MQFHYNGMHTLVFHVFESHTCFNLNHLYESVDNHFNDANNNYEMILMSVGSVVTIFSDHLVRLKESGRKHFTHTPHHTTRSQIAFFRDGNSMNMTEACQDTSS